MPRFTLLALTGPAGAGKDSTADYLVRHAGFLKLAFADALRAEVAEAFDLAARFDILTDRATKETPHDALALRNCFNGGQGFGFIGAVATATNATVDSAWLDAPRSPRQILQWWGTEYRRRQNDHYWIVRLANKVGLHRGNGYERIVVTDCRFANELAWVQSVRGQLWRIDRPGLPAVEGTHASAAGLAEADAAATLRNDADLEALRTGVLRQWWALDSGIAPERLHVELAA